MKFFERIRMLPAVVMLGYLLLTFAVFLIWPINWPIFHVRDWWRLSGYVLLVFAGIFVGYRAGVRRGTFMAIGSASPGNIVAVGSVLAVVLLPPSTYLYTGRWPWEVWAALQDQGEAYRKFQEQLIATTGQRGLISAVRAIAAPLTFAVVPLTVLHWRTFSLPLRIAGCVAGLAWLTFSAMRATDKESADLLIIIASCALVGAARGGLLAPRELMKRYWKPTLAALSFFIIATALYGQRKSERVGGIEARSAICANDSTVCADIDSPGLFFLPRQQRFAVSIFVLSTTQGYYGLALALEKDFRSSYGVGHSPAALGAYELLTGDRQLIRRTFTYRNGFEGWGHENFWSSLVTWLANDFGFAGAALLLVGFGWVWGKAWRDGAEGGSDAAAIVFAASMVILFYLPANNQFFASYDGYTIITTWLGLWLRDYLRSDSWKRGRHLLA